MWANLISFLPSVLGDYVTAIASTKAESVIIRKESYYSYAQIGHELGDGMSLRPRSEQCISTARTYGISIYKGIHWSFEDMLRATESRSSASLSSSCLTSYPWVFFNRLEHESFYVCFPDCQHFSITLAYYICPLGKVRRGQYGLNEKNTCCDPRVQMTTPWIALLPGCTFLYLEFFSLKFL